MIEGIPFLIPATMIATALCTALVFLLAVERSGASRRKVAIIGAVSAGLLVVHGALAAGGFYLELQALPPRFIVAAPPAILILLILVFSLVPLRQRALRTLTLLHTVRIPVELVLWGLFLHGQVPKLMTFEGINPDILSGLTAPLIAWLGFREGRPRRALLAVWNLAALALLFNIVWHAVLSVPTPLQRYGFDQPNVGVLYFPFIWLPAFIVPAVLTAHVWSLVLLFRGKGESEV